MSKTKNEHQAEQVLLPQLSSSTSRKLMNATSGSAVDPLSDEQIAKILLKEAEEREELAEKIGFSAYLNLKRKTLPNTNFLRNVIQRTVGYNRASQHDDRRSKSNTKQVDEIVKPEKEEDHISSEEEIYETKRKGVRGRGRVKYKRENSEQMSEEVTETSGKKKKKKRKRKSKSKRKKKQKTE